MRQPKAEASATCIAVHHKTRRCVAAPSHEASLPPRIGRDAKTHRIPLVIKIEIQEDRREKTKIEGR